MLRYLIALALAFTATPLAAQTVTSVTQLVDQTPLTPGIIVGKAVTTPPSKKGTVLFDCGSKAPPFVYAVGSVANCPKPQAIVQAAPEAIQTPRITTAPKDYGSSSQIAYGSTSNVHAIRAMDAFPLRVSANPIAISDVTADYARDFIAPGKTGTTLNNVTVERVQATVSKRGVYIRGDSANWIVRDFRFVSSAPRTDSSIQAGIALTSTAHDVLIERGYLEGFDTLMPGSKYRQGDCVSSERGNYNVTIRKVECAGPKDGGFDLKSSATRLDDLKVTSAGHYSYRLWAQGTAGTLVSINPGVAHVQAASLTTDWIIDKLVAVGGGPLVVFDKAGGFVEIQACDLSKYTPAPGTPLTKGKGTVTLGPTCKLP